MFIILIILINFISFIINQWDDRLKRDYPPTYCINGTERLRWYQPIPSLFGIGIMLRHQRKGGKVIWRYVVGEYVTALLLGLAVWEIGWNMELAVALWLTAILVIIVQTDLTNMIIPNKVVFSGVIGAVVLRVISHPLPWYEYVIGAVAGSGALLLIAIVGQWLLKKEAMGGGDIKLYLFIGAVLGWKLTLLSLFLASVVGFAGGLIALLLAKKGEQGRPLPFGPYIAIGTLFAYYWGTDILKWYLSLLSIT